MKEKSLSPSLIARSYNQPNQQLYTRASSTLHSPPPPPQLPFVDMAATAAAAATSSFMGTRLPEVHSGNGRVQARFGFGGKKAPAKKSVSKSISDRPLWYPGAKAPEWLDGSLVGDYGFDPFGLGKPAEYLQFDLDSLDQNLAKNVAGDIIGTRTEFSDVKSTPFQPYSEVFGLQRFRECELIHGRWAMLATLGALTVEGLTGVTWQDAGKVRNISCRRILNPVKLLHDREINCHLVNKEALKCLTKGL